MTLAKKMCRRRPFPGYFSRWSTLSGFCVVNIFAVYRCRSRKKQLHTNEIVTPAALFGSWWCQWGRRRAPGSYAFGLFSDTLKESLGFSQSSVDVIASVGEAGLWSTFLVGLLLERRSPREVYAIGSLASGLGLGFVSLAVGKVVPSNPASVGAFFYLANFGSACYAQTATTTVLRNFPATDRGKVSGFIKSIFGLSSAVLSVLYAGLFGAYGVGKFLLLLSVGVPLLGALSSIPLTTVPDKHLGYATERAQGVEPRMKFFYIWFGSVTSYLLAAAAPALLPFTLPAPWTGIFLAILVLSVSAVPLLYGQVYFREATVGGPRESSTDGDGSDIGEEIRPLLRSSEWLGSMEGIGTRNLTWMQCLQDVRFFVLFLSFMSGAGSGLVVINNVTSLADSLGMASSDLLVSVIGISNALGRLGSGWISDRVVSAGLPRSLVLCAMLLVTCGVDLLLAAGIQDLLYPLCVAAGLCYGSMFALVLALTADLFGPRHLGTNYGLMDLGPALGSFLFATGVVALFYEDTTEEDSSECVGPQCFGGTFLVTAISCLSACVLVYVFLVRSDLNNRFYTADL